MGCHLGWYFTVGCPLRDGRGEEKKQGFRSIKKTNKEKNIYIHPFKFGFEFAAIFEKCGTYQRTADLASHS
jgi:hypothetical protein